MRPAGPMTDQSSPTMGEPTDDRRDSNGPWPGSRVSTSTPDDEEGLYRLLGMRMRMLERDPSVAGDFAPRSVAPAELGITVPTCSNSAATAFLRIAAIGQTLVCGTEANQGFYLQRLLTTLGTDTATVTAAVATLLIAQLAIAPAVAGVVATIIVGKVAPTSLARCARCGAAKVAAGPRRPRGRPARRDAAARAASRRTNPPAPSRTPNPPRRPPRPPSRLAGSGSGSSLSPT